MKPIYLTTVSIVIALVLVGGVVLWSAGRRDHTSISPAISNTSVVNGEQIITINAKGGYWPQVTRAKAGMPTTIRVATQGTFDCSSALTIPSLGYTKNLPASGETSVAVPAQPAGTTIRGLCAMGMYNFSIQFE
ncbi:MAG: cupredoxin domain-containing protein [Patescibacteria group bacterium]